MSTAALIQRAHAAGVSLQLVDGKVKARGTKTAVSALIEPLREHKADLIKWLSAAQEMVRRIANPATPEEHALVTFQLLNAAMRVCENYGDSEVAREAMRVQCLEVPEHLHAELLEHFRFARQSKSPPPLVTGLKTQANEKPRHHIEAPWRELAQAYHAHHFKCTPCKSAGQGRGQRCGAGAALWVNYQSAT